jgi:hypothetical protein
LEETAYGWRLFLAKFLWISWTTSFLIGAVKTAGSGMVLEDWPDVERTLTTWREAQAHQKCGVEQIKTDRRIAYWAGCHD